jgi:hypothetical protein
MPKWNKGSLKKMTGVNRNQSGGRKEYYEESEKQENKGNGK